MKTIKDITIVNNQDVTIVLSDETKYTGYINHEYSGYYLQLYGERNSAIFTQLGIENEGIYEYVSNVLGYSTASGMFPYCKTVEDVVKVLKALSTYNHTCLGTLSTIKDNIVTVRKKKSTNFNFKL